MSLKEPGSFPGRRLARVARVAGALLLVAGSAGSAYSQVARDLGIEAE